MLFKYSKYYFSLKFTVFCHNDFIVDFWSNLVNCFRLGSIALTLYFYLFFFFHPSYALYDFPRIFGFLEFFFSLHPSVREGSNFQFLSLLRPACADSIERSCIFPSVSTGRGGHFHQGMVHAKVHALQLFHDPYSVHHLPETVITALLIKPSFLELGTVKWSQWLFYCSECRKNGAGTRDDFGGIYH